MASTARSLNGHPPEPELELVEVPSNGSFKVWSHGYPFRTVRWHFHPEYEIHLITTTTGRAFVGDHIGPFQPGNLMLVGPNLPHNWISDIPAGTEVSQRCLVLQFTAAFASGITALFPEMAFLDGLLAEANRGLEFTPHTGRVARPILDEMLTAAGGRRIELLFGVLGLLAADRQRRPLARIGYCPVPSDYMNRPLNHVLAHISRNLGNDLRESDLAALSGYSRSAFCRAFQRHTGMNFVAYVNSLRISRACELLLGGQRRVVDICFEVGFSNLSNFNRQFLAQKLTPPSTVRNQHLGQSNIFLGREKLRFGLLDRARMRREAEALFQRLGVHLDLSVEVRRLSVAQQQFIEIAKALALDARILILDEPTATLTPADAEHLFIIMRELRRQGVAMVFISHHMEEIFEICDRITVLRDGQYVGDTMVADTDHDTLVQMMVGRRVERAFPPKPAKPASPRKVLEVEGLQIDRNGPVNAFTLHEGEILGFAGLVGSGRTEAVMAVLGADPVQRKSVKVEGREVALGSPAEALALGLGILPESRKVEGLITSFPILQNVSINNLGKYPALGMFIDGGAERRATAAVIASVGVKAPGMDTVVETLSGGNQQKVVLARWLNHHAKILFFDEPTRGIDIGAKAEIYLLMRALTERGYSIVMVSSELPEIVGMCDRVAVFWEGRIVRTLEGDDINPTEVMRHATAGGSHELH